MNADALAEKLANEIRSQDALHSSLLKDLAELASRPEVTEDDFHTSFLKALSKSGLETKIQNAVFHLLRNKGTEDWIKNALDSKSVRTEPLSYIVKIQQQWERRIIKSLNSMSSELGLCLARPRCQEEQDEILAKWDQLSDLDMDISLFRPVYAPKDFLEILSQVISPNMVENCCAKPWGIISVPLALPSLDDLKDKFGELSRGEPHLGVNPAAPSPEDPTLSLEKERYNLGLKVISSNHAPLSQEFLKKGAPASLRGQLWAQVLGTSEVAEQQKEYFAWLQLAVVKNDIMMDKLIIKDVQLTSANDDNYFVFEDVILQVLLCFSRDTTLLKNFESRCANPFKAILRGKSNATENTVIYPPNGIVPFHGFSMYCAPFCYVFADTCQLYFTFTAFYSQFCSKLHEISSEGQGIVSLCAIFENLVRIHEPDLWLHLLKMDIQPLKIAFRWIMRGFSGHLPPEQLLYLWDLVLAYDSMEVFPLLAATILSFRRENLLIANNLHNVEAVLADLSSLPVIPLLQLALKKNSDRLKLGKKST